MQKIAVLYDASQAVLSTFDLDEILRQILAVIHDYFQVAHAGVFLLDERKGDLCLSTRSGWPETPELRVPIGKGIAGEAARDRRPIYVPDVRLDARYAETIPGTRSELAIPLMVRDRVVGVLDCQSDHAHSFSEESIDLLTLFSTQASIALQNAKLYELERRRAAQLEAINAIARQSTAVTDLSELLSRMCAMVQQSFQVDHVSVLLLEEHRLVLRAQHGNLGVRLREGDDLPASAGVFGQALSTRAPVLVDEITDDSDYVPGFLDARSELCLPLVSLGQPLGVMSLASRQPGAFRNIELGPVESVADICSAAFQNALYLERVRQLAFRDGLTGIFNRRLFEMRILEELERARRYELVLSIVMIDLDGFKSLNDEFGHLLGDEALRQMTTIFSQQMRKVDVVCRYGGDEFAILLPETGGQKAFTAAEKLRRTIANWAFPGVPRPLTISAGIAAFPEHGRTRDQLIKAADDALYCAKQSGRNRVLFGSPACDSEG